MSNIYICFNEIEEMHNFIIDLLNLRDLLNGSNKTKRSKKKQEAIKKGIYDLLTIIESGLYCKLYRFYPGGRIPEGIDASKPWTAPGLFNQGIRSIYTKKSYMHRPGIWLVIDLRNNGAGREKREWIMENVPESRIGLNVPLPETYILKQHLETVKHILFSSNPYPNAETALEYLIKIKERQPEMFNNEDVYLWEDMARIFYAMDLPEKAVFCFESQAELMPGCSDPYLNLGVLYQCRGQFITAVEIMLKGLEVNPGDEYLYFNLSSLLVQNGLYSIALKYLNSAILANPDRGMNYYLKGDIHFARHEYHAAISAYEWALELFDITWAGIAGECRLKLADAYDRIGNKELATKIRSAKSDEKAENTDKVTFGRLFYETGELHYEGQIKNNKPWGKGIKYFKNGLIEMEGIFGDWFIEQGKEYYPNGNLKFEGQYNCGPRNYYGPRYFVEGRLYYETGELWYEGTFDIKQYGSLGYPMFKKSESFLKGTEYNQKGEVIKHHDKKIDQKQTISAADRIREKLIQHVMKTKNMSRKEAEALVDCFY